MRYCNTASKAVVLGQILIPCGGAGSSWRTTGTAAAAGTVKGGTRFLPHFQDFHQAVYKAAKPRDVFSFLILSRASWRITNHHRGGIFHQHQEPARV